MKNDDIRMQQNIDLLTVFGEIKICFIRCRQTPCALALLAQSSLAAG